MKGSTTRRCGARDLPAHLKLLVERLDLLHARPLGRALVRPGRYTRRLNEGGAVLSRLQPALIRTGDMRMGPMETQDA